MSANLDLVNSELYCRISFPPSPADALIFCEKTSSISPSLEVCQILNLRICYLQKLQNSIRKRKVFSLDIKWQEPVSIWTLGPSWIWFGTALSLSPASAVSEDGIGSSTKWVLPSSSFWVGREPLSLTPVLSSVSATSSSREKKRLCPQSFNSNGKLEVLMKNVELEKCLFPVVKVRSSDKTFEMSTLEVHMF